MGEMNFWIPYNGRETDNPLYSFSVSLSHSAHLPLPPSARAQAVPDASAFFIFYVIKFMAISRPESSTLDWVIDNQDRANFLVQIALC